MMFRTFSDMKFFFMFYVIVMIGFAVNLSILKQAEYLASYKYTQLAGYMLSVFRISVGDSNFEDFEFYIPRELEGEVESYGSDDIYRFIYVYWVITLIVLNIVFMNFIIAVISESYSRVMSNSMAEVYKVRANMILEREAFISRAEARNRMDMFPRYIL